MVRCWSNRSWSASSRTATSWFVPPFRPNWPRSVVSRPPSSWASTLQARTRGDRPVIRGVPTGDCFRQAANAPRLIDAVGQLVNPDAWQPRPNLGAFVVRFPSEEDPGDTGWHIDSSFQPPGDPRWFVNYRSKERALLLLCLLSDVGMDDAPSRLLAGSHREMARLLAPAGEEGLPGAYQGQASEIPLPASRSGEVFATGSAGDVFICHPFLVHAASWPHRGEQPRFLAQPPIASRGLNLDGPLNRLSPVARAIRLGIREGNSSC